MPLTVASVLGFIPTNIWRPLKKFITNDETIVFDLAFKMSTKYTPGLLIIMICLSFANEFVRNIELDCSSNGVIKNTQGLVFDSTDTDKGLIDYYWNHGTFLVVKALQPNMKRTVSYPGISSYDKEKDEVIRQHYYKHVWLIFSMLTVIAFSPFFFWKIRGVKKLKPLIAIANSVDDSEEEQLSTRFLQTVGFNDGFAWQYVFCKIFVAFSPLGQWYLLCIMIDWRPLKKFMTNDETIVFDLLLGAS